MDKISCYTGHRQYVSSFEWFIPYTHKKDEGSTLFALRGSIWNLPPPRAVSSMADAAYPLQSQTIQLVQSQPSQA